MKILVGNETGEGSYTFNPAARTITLNGLTSGGRFISIRQEMLLLVTNVTRGVIIYNFADPTMLATVSNNIVTLQFNTTTMSATDKLQIFIEVDDQSQELLALLQRLVKLTECLGMVDSSNRQRVSIDSSPSLTVSAVTSITNPITVANITTISGLNPYYNYIDTARIAYNTGIRDKLIFS